MASGPPCHPPPPLSALTQLDSRRNSFSKERLAQTAQGWGHCHHHTGGCPRTAALRDVVGGHGRGGPGLDLGISALSFPLPSPAQSSHTATTLPTRASVSPMGGAGGGSHLRLAIRLLLRPIPRHFSRWGAKREAAMLRLQLGQTHSLFFHWLYTCPKMSTPGWSTISVGQEGWRGGWGGREISPALRLTPEICPCRLPPPFPPHRSPSCCRGRCHPGRSSRI